MSGEASYDVTWLSAQDASKTIHAGACRALGGMTGVFLKESDVLKVAELLYQHGYRVAKITSKPGASYAAK